VSRDIPRSAKYRASVRDIPRLPAGPRRAGEVRARLALIGRPIGPYDVLIAGQALARQLTLVTHNPAEFGRIEGLAVEDWEAP
jgi:tRNA(fMet)-specific endonuclease VapC